MNQKTEIEKIFSEKFHPAIAPAVEARNAITGQRQKIEADRQGFLKKITVTETAIAELETALDEKIIAGKNADDILQKISSRQGELRAYDRQLQRLQGEDTDAATAEKKANEALSVAIGKVIEDLRPDIQALLESHLEAALAVLVGFENEGHKAETACGVELPKEKNLAVYRFLNLGDHFKRLGAFLDGCGEDVSAIRRRETRELWAAREAAREKQAAA